jgi:hypothetical protein
MLKEGRGRNELATEETNRNIHRDVEASEERLRTSHGMMLEYAL